MGSSRSWEKILRRVPPAAVKACLGLGSTMSSRLVAKILLFRSDDSKGFNRFACDSACLYESNLSPLLVGWVAFVRYLDFYDGKFDGITAPSNDESPCLRDLFTDFFFGFPVSLSCLILWTSLSHGSLKFGLYCLNVSMYWSRS